MNLIFCLFCLFFSCFTTIQMEAKSKKVDIALCAMFQNEADYLDEWLLYHRLIGVQKFYLYNNNSSDHYKQVLKSYISAGWVDLKDWPSPETTDWTPYQKSAYNDCLERCRKNTTWMIFLDTDEYIVLHKQDTLKEFLKPYEKDFWLGGIVLNWQMFGTSGLYDLPKDKFMIESLTWKAPHDYLSNSNQKSIVKVERCMSYEIHYANYVPGFYHGKPYNSGLAYGIDQAQINHYWTRNERFLREVKAPRRARYEGMLWTEETIQWIIQQHHVEQDFSIQRFVPKMKMLKLHLQNSCLKTNDLFRFKATESSGILSVRDHHPVFLTSIYQESLKLWHFI